MDDFQQMMLEHVRKTELHMRDVTEHMAQARQARAAHDKSINCLRDSFKEFREKYGPMLETATTRQKWWSERTEEVQKKTVLAAGWVLVMALVYGLGHAVIFLLKKVNVFLGN